MTKNIRWILVFTMILILACAISTPVTGGTVHDYKRARDIVITPAPAMERMESESRWMNSK